MARLRARYTGNDLNEAALRALVTAAPGSITGDDLDRRGARVERAAQRLVGRDTGRLAGTIRRERGAGYVDIVAGRRGVTPYLGFHHYNTEAHVIRPRRAKALRFVVGGRTVFAQKVQHPGTRGSRFLTRALAAARLGLL